MREKVLLGLDIVGQSEVVNTDRMRLIDALRSGFGKAAASIQNVRKVQRVVITKGIRTTRELDEERGKKAAAGLLVNISKVKIKVRHRSRSSLTEGRDFVDDCGTMTTRQS
jgi:hypothetical protein